MAQDGKMVVHNRELDDDEKSNPSDDVTQQITESSGYHQQETGAGPMTGLELQSGVKSWARALKMVAEDRAL